MELKDLGELRRYLNINITNTPLVYYLDQSDYIGKILTEFPMDDAHEVTTPMLEDDRKRWDEHLLSPLLDDKDKKRFQAVIGSVLYVMDATRPDLAYTVIRLSQYASSPRIIHWEAANRVLKYIKGTRYYGLALGNVSSLASVSSPSNTTSLVVYFDTAHADTRNRHSTCGYLFPLNSSPVSCCSRVQRMVALSTTELSMLPEPKQLGKPCGLRVCWTSSVVHALFLGLFSFLVTIKEHWPLPVTLWLITELNTSKSVIGSLLSWWNDRLWK